MHWCDRLTFRSSCIAKTALLAIAAGLLFPSAAAAQVTLSGAGSTFVEPIMAKWIAEYQKKRSDVVINYLPIGSGAGIAQTMRGMLDFGATDAPLTDDQLSRSTTKIIHVPVVIGSDVPAYNLQSTKSELKFTPEILAKIFLGQITIWNDPAIRSANPGIALPEKAIVVVHRSDGSGTTYVWTDYLSKVSTEWKQRVGKGTAVKWPVGIEGKGNEGVAAAIRQTDGAIGYLELAYAVRGKIEYGSVQNAAGRFIKATVESTSAAATSEKEIPTDLRVSISDAPGAESYPVASFSWVLLPANLRGTPKGKALADFLAWIVGDGQKFTADLSYAPLPGSVALQARKAIEQEK